MPCSSGGTRLNIIDDTKHVEPKAEDLRTRVQLPPPPPTRKRVTLRWPFRGFGDCRIGKCSEPVSQVDGRWHNVLKRTTAKVISSTMELAHLPRSSMPKVSVRILWSVLRQKPSMLRYQALLCKSIASRPAQACRLRSHSRGLIGRSTV